MIHRVIVCLALALTVSTRAAQQPGPQDPKPSKHSGLPAKGEFIDSQTQNESIGERENRRKREEKYKDTYKPITDSGPEPVTTTLVINDYTERPSSIPVAKSNAIIIGSIIGGKAFVSQDHTSVYSDYQVRVDQILKQDTSASASLFVGGLITATRLGGTIRFPSGNVRHFVNHKEGMPIIGGQYLLFLRKLEPDILEYFIVLGGAYQLKNGRAYALDDFNDEYDDVSASILLNKVQEAIGGRP